jgi:hypothetical protein
MSRIQGDISADNAPDSLVVNLSGHTNEPTYYSSVSDPLFTLHCTAPWGPCPLENVQIHIPAGAEIEGGQAADPNLPMDDRTDAHLTIVDQTRMLEYDLWQVQVNPIPAAGGPLNISWGGIVPINGDGTASQGTGTGSGVAENAGRIRIEEFAAGQINHALGIGVECTGPQFVYPANQHDELCSDMGLSNTNAPAMGMQLQLNMSAAEIDSLPVPAWKKTLLHAMATYGMFIIETGSGFLFDMETESGGQYRSLGYPDPWLAFAVSNGWSFYAPDQNYVGDLSLNADGFNWSTVWSRLRVIDPCWAAGTCP